MPKAPRSKQSLYGCSLAEIPPYPIPRAWNPSKEDSNTKSKSSSKQKSSCASKLHLNRNPKSKQLSTSTSTPTSSFKPSHINHLELLIKSTDLLPLSSPSLIDSARLYHTILPFPNVKTVTLIMGFRRSTDVEEVCLHQDLEGLKRGLEEFLGKMRGKERREEWEGYKEEGNKEGGKKGKGLEKEVEKGVRRVNTPALKVQWLYPVEEHEDWVDYLMSHYGFE